ncbi:MAG: ABC transporter permease [Chloroflexota bacterium]
MSDRALQQPTGGLLRYVNRNTISEFGVLIAIILLIIGFSFASPFFFTVSNFANIGRQTTLLAITSFAMTFVILSGEIDISIGAIASLSGVVIALLLREQFPMLLAILAGLTVGGLAGLLNGVITVKGKIPSFIVTLGTLSVIQGTALAMTNASTIVFSNDLYRDLFARASLFGIPAPVIFAVVLFFVLNWLLTSTRFGSNIYAVGGGADTARLAGIPVDRVKILVFTLSGVLTAMASLVLTARVGNGQPLGAQGLELDAIAAVVLGGTSFLGGRGALWRTVLGALLIGVLNNGLTLVSIAYYPQLLVKGGIIILAVYIDSLTRGQKS